MNRHRMLEGACAFRAAVCASVPTSVLTETLSTKMTTYLHEEVRVGWEISLIQRQVTVFYTSLEDQASFQTLQERRRIEHDCLDSMRIASIQFAALAITFMIMVIYYACYGWNAYQQRTSAPAVSIRMNGSNIQEQSHSAKQQQ